MQSYLSAESTFLRAFGNRCLLLLFLCVLSRTASTSGRASVLGLSIDVSPGTIVVLGPVLALLFLISLKMEADNLMVARNDLLGQNQRAPRVRIGWPLYALFGLPTATAAFLFSQYFLKLVPADIPGAPLDECNTFDRSGYLFDFRRAGFPTKYCIGNLPSDGMPWIYPPYQTYGYILLILGCAYLSYVLCRDWRKYR
jgi:hypothetical protein